MTLDSRPPPRLLIVDGHPDTRILLTCWFEDCCGCVVAATGTALDALTRLPIFAPDVVVTDIALPQMDGMELCRRLRLDPVTRSIPVIAATGFAMPHQIADAHRAGFDRVLTKPYALTELLDEVTSLLPAWVRPPVSERFQSDVCA